MVMILMMMVVNVKSDAKDRAECTNQLIGLSTCLPYVGGTAKAPTPDCCSGLKQVLVKSKKCLCVLVKDRNDPGLGLKLNASLALNLPSICKSDVSIADCPALLNLPPNSPEAQVFQQFEKSLHNKSPAANTTTPTTTPGSTVAPTGRGSRSVGVQMVVQICLWCFTLLLFFGV